jgi:hypothetical protein
MAEHETLPLHLTVDLESVPNQIGNAILRSSNGSILKAPNGSLSEQDTNILYKILLEMGYVLKDQTQANADGESVNGSHVKEELLKKVTVQGGNGISYCMGVSVDGLVFIVKKRNEA